MTLNLLKHPLRSRESFLFRLYLSGLTVLVMLLSPLNASAQEHSVAYQWNEVLLGGIRNDLARPTVHARNLFHISTAMYDIWAAYDEVAEPFFLGHTLDGYTFPFSKAELPAPEDVKAAREEAISFAVYRLMKHRFQRSPKVNIVFGLVDDKMLALGYDPSFISSDWQSGNPAALGNYVAEQIIAFGLQDGSNEQFNYTNRFYRPINEGLVTKQPGNPDVEDPNRWQPLTLDLVIDQSGNVIPVNTPPFLSPEWGQVTPFALNADELTVYQRDGFDYWVYHDPGPPPYIDPVNGSGISDYHWTFTLVGTWSSHLDPNDGVMWDISPGALGNLDINSIPRDFAAYRDFYKLLEGGVVGSNGRAVNPHTGQPYEPQLVPRGDYTRVLAEFWADGPESETPPGHWFTILNYVTDHPEFEARFAGQGEILDPLEWDVKAYFTLGGAVHDAAVTAWGIKGWYDYVRPISAIRYMCDQGQCSDPNQPNYHPGGLPLIEGYIELVKAGDPLAGAGNANVGKVKIKAWRGPTYIQNPNTDYAGVGWVLAENWWPYQRPTFVSPPFAGYISGHSTFSRTAAEVLTALTGDAFFPGGMGEFHAKKNDFLVFEVGPSTDVTLQWATYRDASDQTSLSRIWGGIHPPADDLPGRLIGDKIGKEAFILAEKYFKGGPTGIFDKQPRTERIPAKVYPNPIRADQQISVEIDQPDSQLIFQLSNLLGQTIRSERIPATQLQTGFHLSGGSPIPAGTYVLRIIGRDWETAQKIVIE